MQVQKTEVYTITLSEKETVELAQTLYSDLDFSKRPIANSLWDALADEYTGDESLEYTI